MSNSFVFLHGGFIFVHLVAHFTQNLTALIISMLVFDMSFETAGMNKLEAEPTLSLASRICKDF